MLNSSKQLCCYDVKKTTEKVRSDLRLLYAAG